MISGSMTRSRFPGVTRGRPGLGIEVNLLKLGGWQEDLMLSEQYAQQRIKDRIEAQQAEAAAARAQKERASLLEAADKYAQAAFQTQENLLQSGRSNLSSTLKGTIAVAGMSLAAFVAVSVFRERKKRRRRRSRSRSRRKTRSR